MKSYKQIVEPIPSPKSSLIPSTEVHIPINSCLVFTFLLFTKWTNEHHHSTIECDVNQQAKNRLSPLWLPPIIHKQGMCPRRLSTLFPPSCPRQSCLVQSCYNIPREIELPSRSMETTQLLSKNGGGKTIQQLQVNVVKTSYQHRAEVNRSQCLTTTAKD